MDMKLLIVGILIFVVGGFLFYLAIRNLLKCKEEAEGTVVGVERKRMNRKNQYYPVVEFEAQGRTIRKTADVSSAFSTKYKEGKIMKVKYNADNPEEFFIKGKSFWTDFLGGLFLMAIGVFLIVLQFKG
ncbi:MAG: DUF3592 domain-containing protein [Lachnospiraceae bacterium]|nr:DUF3592 domain-containing protein [Lachnospiraceae bacterium]